MPTPFSNISLHLPSVYQAGTTAHRQELLLANYVSDLYCRCLLGYKPPYCTRVNIQPYYYGDRKHSWKTGSLIAVAPFFDEENFALLNTAGKYRCLLDLVQECMLQLSDEYRWDRSVFENAYRLVLDKNFVFAFNFPPTLSKNRKMSAYVSIEKNIETTFVYATIVTNGAVLKIKLYEKTNSFWHDCSYVLARHTKWFNDERFGINYPKGRLSVSYSVTDKVVASFQDDLPVENIDFRKSFWMQ